MFSFSAYVFLTAHGFLVYPWTVFLTLVCSVPMLLLVSWLMIFVDESWHRRINRVAKSWGQLLVFVPHSCAMFLKRKSWCVKTTIIVVIIGLFVAGCGGGGSSSGGGTSAEKIVVIGDSIGNGFGIATPYPARIRSTTGVPVVNDSVSGRLTDEGLAVAQRLLTEHQPSHLVVLLGTNDSRMNINSSVSNLQMIVNLGVAAGAKVVVGTLPPITNSSGDNARSALISGGIRGLNDATIAEVRGAMGDGTATIADGIHPNDVGQEIIAREFLNHL